MILPDRRALHLALPPEPQTDRNHRQHFTGFESRVATPTILHSITLKVNFSLFPVEMSCGVQRLPFSPVCLSPCLSGLLSLSLFPCTLSERMLEKEEKAVTRTSAGLLSHWCVRLEYTLMSYSYCMYGKPFVPEKKDKNRWNVWSEKDNWLTWQKNMR